jgi:hypothetical protein
MGERYQGTFADFDYDYIELGQQLGDKWQDMTWKNDSCPKFTYMIGDDNWYDLWFDYKEPTLSETAYERGTGEIKQFNLTDQFGHELLNTDDWEEMRKAIVDDNIVQKHWDNYCEQRAMDNGG